MTESTGLPTFSAEALANASIEELSRWLVRSEDRVPRNLIDECARRGDEMAAHLGELLGKDYYWGEDQSAGEWWLLHHAVMILGLVPTERAGELLVGFMRRIDEARDENLHDWLAGYWPAFFRNKPEPVVSLLRSLAQNRQSDPFVRYEAANAVIACAARPGSTWPLESALDWAAAIAFARNEDRDLRALLGNTLLGFARVEHRLGLESLADVETAMGPVFTREDITRVYAIRGEAPDWERFADPWKFYSVEEIVQRQLDRAEEVLREEREALAQDGYEGFGETYVRPGPKIGRNEPCPCGSGKKYKKCCMAESG
jgi:hypothetical protein